MIDRLSNLVRVFCVCLIVPLAGCAASRPAASTDAPSARATIPAGEYLTAFESAKSTLRDIGFLLERVDAQSGVITTKPLSSAGVAAPWDAVQSGIDQEFEDLLQRQQRVVRIEFVPAGSTGDAPRPDDLRSANIPVEARITATIYRVNLDGLRINTHSILYCTYAVDTELDARGMTNYPVAIREDNRLADRIAMNIERGMKKGS